MTYNNFFSEPSCLGDRSNSGNSRWSLPKGSVVEPTARTFCVADFAKPGLRLHLWLRIIIRNGKGIFYFCKRGFTLFFVSLGVT
jgi:hypothetical protein